MTTRSGGTDGQGRSVVILDPDDGSPLIVIVPHPTAPEKSDKALPAGRDIAPPADKK
jgi:hypothetical protein